MPKKILIVEDEQQLIEMLEIRLRENKYEVIAASNGEEGLEKARKERPDLILMDVMMPKKDGWSLLREIRLDKSMKDIPIIMLTAKDNLRDMFELEGVEDFVAKPFETAELMHKINVLLSKKKF